jgi:hypothetical protein
MKRIGANWQNWHIGSTQLRAPLIIKLAVACLFWLAVALIQKFNWGLGVEKALVLAVLLLATPGVVALAERRRPARDSTAPRSLVVAIALLLVAQTAYAVKELRHPSLIDAATTTLAAGEVLRGGASPYATALDPAAIALAGDQRFGGYKYLPVTIAAYLPLGAPFGQRGIVLTNLLLQGATAWLIFRLALRMAGASAAWLALLFYLSLPLVPFQLFAKGATDLAAVLPLLAALLLLERRPGLAGLCLGLSFAAKPLPAALLLPCCLPGERPGRLAYATGIAAGLLPVLPFLIWSPVALLDNVVLFNLLRPADSTSWLSAVPPLAATLAHAALALLYVGVAAYAWLRPPTLLRRTGAAVVLMLAAILAAPAAHHNYQLWWLPLAVPLLAALLAPPAAPAVYEAPKLPA